MSQSLDGLNKHRWNICLQCRSEQLPLSRLTESLGFECKYNFGQLLWKLLLRWKGSKLQNCKKNERYFVINLLTFDSKKLSIRAFFWTIICFCTGIGSTKILKMAVQNWFAISDKTFGIFEIKLSNLEIEKMSVFVILPCSTVATFDTSLIFTFSWCITSTIPGGIHGRTSLIWR